MSTIEKALRRLSTERYGTAANFPSQQGSGLQQEHGAQAGTRVSELAPRNVQSLRRSGPQRRRARVQKSFNLPVETMQKQGMITPDSSRNQLSEEYRAIKRRVLKAVDSSTGRKAEQNQTRNTKLVMVTSCVSGEGKTFSAINLAISIAMERDRSVLLVDADVTNPVAGQRLDIDNESGPGLTSLLNDPQIDIEDAIWQSSIPNLQVMPAGPSHNHVTELLSSRNMENLVDRLTKRRREQIIVIDSAPILLTSESSVVADLAGQIVFVVAANSTTKSMVDEALRIISDKSKVGFILNKTRRSLVNLYGYGYGYGYGQKRASNG